MPDPKPLPDDLRGRGFTSVGARSAGVGKGRLRRKDLTNPYHGVHTDTPPRTQVERAAVYAAQLKPGQFFSHVTAAAIHGLSVPTGFEHDPVLHVGAKLPADAPHSRNVRGHRLSEILSPVDVGGLPVAHPLDVFCQLGSMLDLEDLVVVADELLNRTATDEEAAKTHLLDRVASARRVGGGALVRAVRAARRGSRSPAETRVRVILESAGVARAELNAPILERGTGRYLGSPDLVWRGPRVALEYEGDGHRVEQAQFRYDILRYDDLMADGWRVIRATGDDLTAPGRPALVERVRRALAAQ